MAPILLAVTLLAPSRAAQGQMLPSPSAESGERSPYTVLFMNLEGSSWPWALSMFSTCRKEFEESTGRQVEMLLEQPAIEDISTPSGRSAFNTLFHERYAERVDFVVAWGPFQELSEIFEELPNVPVILPSQYVWPMRDRDATSANIHAVRGIFSPAKTAQAALKSRPGARKIVVISGTSDLGQSIEERARKEMGTLYEGAAVEYWSGVPVSELRRRVATLPLDHVVLFLVVAKDRNETAHISREVVRQLTAVASVPIFGVANTYLGNGIIGGYVDSSEIVGKRAARMLTLLAEGQPLAAVTEMAECGEYQFDWRQMMRWGISERHIPAEARILNRPSGFFERHRWVLRCLGAVGILLALTVVALLWHLRLRRQASEALKRSELLYRSVVEDLPALVCRNTPNGVIEFVNDAYCAYFGRTREELMGKDLLTLLPEQDRERVRQDMARLSAENPLSIHEHQVVAADGTIRRHRWTNQAIVNDHGEVTMVQAFGEDITDQRSAEEALRESEQKFRLLFERSPDAHVIHLDSRFVDCNRACLDMLRMSDRAELIGRHPADISPPRQEDGADSMEKAEEMIARAVATGSHRFEWTMRRTDGGQLLVDVLLNAITLQGQPALHAVWHDITERKQAEQALRESQRQLTTLMGNLPGMVYRCANDPQWTMEFVSEGCRPLIGYRPAELVANRRVTYGDVIHPNDRQRVWSSIQDALEDRRSFEVVYRITTSGGAEKYVWEQGQGVFDGDGHVTALEGYIADITARQSAEEEIRRNQAKLRALTLELSRIEEREKRRLAVQLHDSVGQDLAVTKLSLQSLAASCGPSEVSTEIGRICSDVDRTIGTVRSVMSKLSNPILYEIGLKAALEAWLEEDVQAKHGIVYTLDADEHISRHGLAIELRIVLFRTIRELVTNVVKHAGADQVRIGIHTDTNGIHVTVADNGTGFPDRSDPDQTGRPKGFGLFSIREQLDELEGHLAITSEPGQGACVTITVPVG